MAVGAQKSSAALCRGVLECCRPDNTTLDAIYDAAFMLQFYWPEEIDLFREKLRDAQEVCSGDLKADVA